MLQPGFAPPEGIEEEVQTAAAITDEEVVREGDPLQGQPEAPTHLQEDDAQGERDAHPAVQHVVQEGVPGVVVRLRVPVEPVPLVEGAGQFLKDEEGSGLLPQRTSHLLRESVQAGEIHLHRKLRILLLGHQEGDPGEVEITLGVPDLADETLPGGRSRCRHGRLSRWEVRLGSLPYPGAAPRWPGASPPPSTPTP